MQDGAQLDAKCLIMCDFKFKCEAGETLSGMARKYDAGSATHLMRWNPSLTKNHVTHEGEEIRVRFPEGSELVDTTPIEVTDGPASQRHPVKAPTKM